MKLPAMLSALGVLLTVSVASAVPLGLTTAQTAHPRLTAEACRSSGFNPRLYDYAIETCTLDFTAMVPESLEDRGQVLQNRKACMAKRIDGLRQCRDRHKGGKAHAACNRKVNAAHRACLYEARVTAFMQPGPEKYRGLICDAARHGLLEICNDYHENYGLGDIDILDDAGGTPMALASLESPTSAAPTTAPATPTPTPCPSDPAASCTSCCVQACLDIYYETYDYAAEEYCYYYTCLCTS